MKKRTTQAAVAGTGIVALTLMCAFAQADSISYAKAQELNTSIEEAANAALTSVSGTIIEAELEFDDNLAVWEFDIVDEANQVMSVEIDGKTGSVLSVESTDDVAPDVTDALSWQQAIEMVRAVENGALIEMELENDDDQLVWEIETVGQNNDESELRVHGITGEIL